MYCSGQGDQSQYWSLFTVPYMNKPLPDYSWFCQPCIFVQPFQPRVPEFEEFNGQNYHFSEDIRREEVPAQEEQPKTTEKPRKTKKIHRHEPIQKRCPENIKKKKISGETIEYPQRDRNIKSNALKLFLKYARHQLSLQKNLFEEIIQKYDLTYNSKEFLGDLNKFIPSNQNYIRSVLIQNICRQRGEYSRNFSLVFRISMHKFFKETIYLLNSRYVRTKKSVRREHIKAGFQLLEEIFESQRLDQN